MKKSLDMVGSINNKNMKEILKVINKLEKESYKTLSISKLKYKDNEELEELVREITPNVFGELMIIDNNSEFYPFRNKEVFESETENYKLTLKLANFAFDTLVEKSTIIDYLLTVAVERLMVKEEFKIDLGYLILETKIKGNMQGERKQETGVKLESTTIPENQTLRTENVTMLKIGDVVTLKSGSCKMVIENIHQISHLGKVAVCVYHDYCKNSIVTDKLRMETLKLYNPETDPLN